MYIDELIGPNTVNTMPPKTLEAFDDHGTPEITIHRDMEGAHRLFQRLPELGIPLEAKIAELEPEGVEAFTKSYEKLLATLEEKQKTLAARR
jgi:transaldolase